MEYILQVDSDIPSLEKELLPRRDYLRFQVVGVGNHGSIVAEPWPGLVCPTLSWQIERLDDLA
jgi:hypothetical protein